MFQTSYNGYDRKSVDEYIAKLKSEIMEQKLSILDNEQRYMDYREKQAELETKERNLYKAVKALQDAQKIRDEGTKTLYTLKLEQLSQIHKKAENLLRTIYIRHPELEKDPQVKSLFEEFDNLLQTTKDGDKYNHAINTPISTDNDSMRILLSKMQDYRNGKDKPREVRFERVQTETKLQIKPISGDEQIGDVDDFLRAKPVEGNKFFKIEEESGFNLEEAINPKEDLATIMKAFDFFSEE